MNNKPKCEQERFMAYKHEALKAAHDLCYGDRVINKIKNAKSIGEISRIMATARQRM